MQSLPVIEYLNVFKHGTTNSLPPSKSPVSIQLAILVKDEYEERKLKKSLTLKKKSASAFS